MVASGRYSFVPTHTVMVSEAAGAVVDLRGIGAALRRRWHWIAVPAALTGGLALAVALSLAPRYEATAKVLLDPRGVQVLQNDPRPDNRTGDETGAEVDSQVQVIASTSLLGKVADELDLSADPEFSHPPAPLAARIAEAIRSLLAEPSSGPSETVEQRTLRTLQNSVTVRRSEKTFVLDVNVQTRDPDKSARIANAIADAFVRETGEVRSDVARRSGSELSGRLEELRKRLQRSDAAVEAYRKNSDLISANGKLVSEQQLADLNTQLTLARTRAADQEARVEAIRRLTRDGSPAETLTEVANSPTIAALRAQYAEATRAEGEARQNYGSRHPAMMAATKQVQIVRQRIAEEVGRLARTAESDYERAKTSETAIARRIEGLKRESAGYSQAQVRLRELERQAAADRTVYESFLNRAKDLDERQALDTGNARVITAAVPPLARAGISRFLIVAGGTTLGALMGIGLVLLRDQFEEASRPRDPVAVEARLPVLAVMPDDTVRDAALRRVRGLLTPIAPAGPARLVVIAGLGTQTKRTSLAQLLARIVSAEGERALLVDGDLESRSLTRLLRAEHNRGLTDVLASPPMTTADTPRSFNGVPVITAGTLDASEVRTSVRALRGALGPHLTQAGFVIVDAGPVGPNLQGFAAIADDILLVVEGGRTALPDLQEALHAFGPGTANVRGIVLAGTYDA